MPSQTTSFESLLEAVPDAMVVVDRAGVIRFVNHQTERLFDYDRADMVGQPIEMLVPESFRKVHTSLREGFVADPQTRGLGQDLDLSGRRRDGTVFPLDVSLSHTGTGDDMLVTAAVRDLTHRKKVEAERRKSDRMAAIVENSVDAIIATTLNGIVTSWNPAAERIYGYPADEMVGQPVLALTPDSHVEGGHAIAERLRAGDTIDNFETIGLRKDGTTFTASVTISPIRHADGAIVGVSAIARDITEQRRAFEADQRMAAIVEHTDDAIVSATLNGNVTSWNPAAERIYGYLGEEMVGRSLALTIPPDRLGEMTSIMSRIGAGQPVDRLETVRVRKDATMIPVSLTVSPILDQHGTIVGASAIVRDITEQRKALEAARSMIESSLDSLVSISPEGKLTDVNEATVRITGVPREELIGTAFSDYFTEPAKANEIYQRVFAVGMAVDYPLTMRHRDGALTDVLYNASVQRDAGGGVLGVFAAARDVTEQRQAFEAARSMIESSLDALVSISPEGKITDVNTATVNVTGVPRENLIGTAFSDYFTEPEKANEIYQRVFAVGMAVDYPLTMRHRDGTLTDVLYNASVQRDAAGNVLGVFAAARDVTKQKQAQNAQAQAAIAQQAKELDRLAELERFQRLTVGRELKMIELKKEIESLRRLLPMEGDEFGDQF
jgi:PAS domain S-box-containing protein